MSGVGGGATLAAVIPRGRLPQSASSAQLSVFSMQLSASAAPASFRHLRRVVSCRAMPCRAMPLDRLASTPRGSTSLLAETPRCVVDGCVVDGRVVHVRVLELFVIHVAACTCRP